MQHNLSLYKQMTGQNRTKLFDMFIYISKIVPQDSQANERNFEKINLWRISQANRTAKTLSVSVETSIAKERALLILRL